MRFKSIIKKIVKTGIDNKEHREKWLKETLEKIPKGSKLLDAGAGEQKYKVFCKHLNYIAQDFAEYDGKGDGIGLQVGSWDQSKLDIISDITQIPMKDESFDAIMCIEVFEHLPNPIQAIREFSRLIRKDGHLIITAPFCSLTHFAPYHFYSGFNIYFYKKYLQEYGFKIVEIQNNGNFFEYLAQEIIRIRDIKNRYVKKRIFFYEWISMFIIVRMLGRLSKNDNGSSEVLNFGYHIYAIKT